MTCFPGSGDIQQDIVSCPSLSHAASWSAGDTSSTAGKSEEQLWGGSVGGCCFCQMSCSPLRGKSGKNAFTFALRKAGFVTAQKVHISALPQSLA